MLYVETHTPHTGAAIQHTYVGHHDLLRAKQIRTFGNSGLYRIAPGRMLAIFPFPQLHNIQSKKNILAYTKQGLPVCGVFRKKNPTTTGINHSIETVPRGIMYLR